MASGVKLLAVLLLGILVTPFVTACGSSGDSSNPCDIVSRLDHAEIKITGPKMDGCGTEVRKEVRAWEFLGLGTDWQYGAPAPTGTPVCTVTSGEQTWGFYDAGGGGAAGAFCQMLKTRAGLHLWQEGRRLTRARLRGESSRMRHPPGGCCGAQPGMARAWDFALRPRRRG
jgi:hypothetical protein